MSTMIDPDLQNELQLLISESLTADKIEMLSRAFYSNIYNDDKFIIKLDDIWQWIGYSTIQNAKRAFLRKYIQEEDYKIVKHDNEQNETIFMRMFTFQHFCIKSRKPKGEQLYDEYTDIESRIRLYTETKIKETQEKYARLQKLDDCYKTINECNRIIDQLSY